jgi:hypothetical protein
MGCRSDSEYLQELVLQLSPEHAELINRLEQARLTLDFTLAGTYCRRSHDEIAPASHVLASVIRFWQALKRFLSMAWWRATPWPLKILYAVLAYVLIFALIAGIAGLEFGFDSAGRVAIFAEDLGIIIGMFCAAVLLVGLILIPFYFASMRLEHPSPTTVEIGRGHRSKYLAWFVSTPWPLKILYAALAYVLVFALAAAVAAFEYGRDSAGRVLTFAEDLSVIIGLVCAPVVLVGVFFAPLYLAVRIVIAGNLSEIR